MRCPGGEVVFPNAEAYTGVKVDLHYGRDVFSVVHAYEIFRDMWPLYCYFFVSAYFFHACYVSSS